MRILITGHRGFIGSELFDHLKDRHELKGIDWKNEDQDIVSDIANQEYISFKPKVIIHLAAIPRIQHSIKHPSSTFRNNVLGTQRVLAYAKMVGCKRVLFAGSSSSKEGSLDNPYSCQKLMGEMLCKMYTNVYGIDTGIMRFHNVYNYHQFGEDMDKNTLISIWRSAIRDNEPITIYGNGKKRRDFTHVYDTITAVETLLSHPMPLNGEVFEIGTGTNISVNNIAEIVRGIYPNQQIVYKEGLPGEVQDTKADNTTIKELGWMPEIHQTEGIRQSFLNLRYHEQNGTT